MSIGDPYATLEDFQQYLGSAFTAKISAQFTIQMGWALEAASDKINQHCERQFNLADGVSMRVFQPGDDPRYVEVDDFNLTDDFSLATDPSGTGDFEVQWQSGLDYELLPLNGVVGGVPGWPYNEIHAVAGVWFPLIQFRRVGTVQVTAQWGWPSVPSAVHQACLLIAHEILKLADAPFGAAGFSAMGALVKVKDIPMAAGMLQKYMRFPINGG